MLIGFQINKCSECPFAYKVRQTTTYDYWCDEANKKIACFVNGPAELPPVPDWCPCKIETETKEEIYEKLEHLSNTNKLHSIITFLLLEKSRHFMYNLKKNFPAASPSEIEKLLEDLGWNKIDSEFNGWQQDTWCSYTHDSYPVGITMAYGGFYGDLSLYRSDIDD